MANPNIVQVSDIRGKVTGQAIETTTAAIVSNASSSGLLVKINSLTIANTDANDPVGVTVELVRGATRFTISPSISVPVAATLVAISKDSSVYLEEGDSLELSGRVGQGVLQAVCSYEEIL